MLPQIDPLPGPKGAATGGHRYGQVHLAQYGPDMGRHVIHPLHGVFKHRVAIRHQVRHESLQITSYRRVGIFTQHQGCAGVMDEQMTDAALYPGAGDDLFHLAGYIIGSTAFGPGLKTLLKGHGCIATVAGISGVDLTYLLPHRFQFPPQAILLALADIQF